jgi:pimeloyl-ACP methyl ester carboxylesterase
MQKSEGSVTAADGTRLHFEVIGDAPQVVLVPNGTYLIDDLAPLAEHRRLAFYDPRNRGKSDAAAGGGVLQDVEDMRAVAVQLATSPVDVIAHSFAGLLAVLYAKAWPQGVRRGVLIAPLGPYPDREYPPSLMNRDETFARVMRDLGTLFPQRAAWSPEEFCEKIWAVLGALYVTNAGDAGRIRWGRCGLENERNGLRYFQEVTLPSIRALALTPDDVAAIDVPVLVVHGTKDRSAPYGGGREWATMLPNARLLAIEGGGHAPWIEAPERVLPAIESFLNGEWPDGSERLA